MAENKVTAREVYESMCQLLEQKKLKFSRVEEKLLVHFSVTGDDLPVQYILMIDDERSLIRLLSPLPFKVPEDKRIEGAVMTCATNYILVDGNFDYDVGDGTIMFRQTASFLESTISEELFSYMIAYSFAVVEEYNDQFYAVCKGYMSLEDFIQKL